MTCVDLGHIIKVNPKRGMNMKDRDWIIWAKKAGIRAAKTIAQAAIAGIGTAAALGQVDWKYVVSASALAGVLSMLTSVAGLPELSVQNDVDVSK